jgi:hypothetical protein
MKTYRLSTIDKMIQDYVAAGGEATTLREGVLGYGQILLHNNPGYKVVVITEVALNEWSSGHKVRMYNKMPKKYDKLLSNLTYED